MELQTKRIADKLLVSARGRLDANWSEYFTDAFLAYIRKGEHDLVLDASELHFLSSAGIRSLILINKELAKLKGKFVMIHANEFVRSTLQTTGLGSWLTGDIPEIHEDATNKITAQTDAGTYYKLVENAFMQFQPVSSWKPWEKVNREKLSKISFGSDTYALGIGSPLSGESETSLKFGEYMAICGNLVYQPPEEKSHPDYLIPLENFTPEMLSIQTLLCQGEMAHLLRFAPDEDKTSTGISELAARALQLSLSDTAAFAVLAEIDGLVGAFMIRSPAELDESENTAYPGIRDWLSFCGERMFSRNEALVFGIASKKESAFSRNFLSSLPSNPGIAAHMHAVVFPHQPLQNGKLELSQQAGKFFNGPPPMALLHLIEDNRPARGLGESTFIRGAMWCSPVKNKEEAL